MDRDRRRQGQPPRRGDRRGAVIAGERVIVSGCTATVNGVVQDLGDPYQQSMTAMGIALEAVQAAGLTPEDVVMVRYYVVEHRHFDLVGQAIAEVFGHVRPACTGVRVAGLVDVEMRDRDRGVSWISLVSSHPLPGQHTDRGGGTGRAHAPGHSSGLADRRRARSDRRRAPGRSHLGGVRAGAARRRPSRRTTVARPPWAGSLWTARTRGGRGRARPVRLRPPRPRRLDPTRGSSPLAARVTGLPRPG
ncbi:Rid family hydrolase [Nonomuraea sp. NPDC049637]|uniref:Rid family hydrolase n=1 Tax=Nonomuraea sp. NPDC049637 TaxID=3154356 RepID=UPI00342D4A1B